MEAKTKTSPLLTSYKMGKFNLSHRVVLPPLTRNRAFNNTPQAHSVEYYSQRATNGGLIISEAAAATDISIRCPNMPGIWTEKQVKAWKPIVEEVHAKGGIIFCQIWHPARVSNYTLAPEGSDDLIKIIANKKVGGDYHSFTADARTDDGDYHSFTSASRTDDSDYHSFTSASRTDDGDYHSFTATSRTDDGDYHSFIFTSRTDDKDYHSFTATSRTDDSDYHSFTATSRTDDRDYHSFDQISRTNDKDHHSFDHISRTRELDLDHKGVVSDKLSIQKSKSIINDFALAARNAIKAGFDGVEIHCGNGYLIERHLNERVKNNTPDPYGGSIERRCRLALDVVQAVSKEIGSERVGIKLSPFDDFHGSGNLSPITIGTYLATQLNNLELVYIHVTEPRMIKTGDGLKTPRSLQPIREAFDGTLIASGGYDKPDGDVAVGKDYADLVSFGRLFVANPDLVKRFELNAPLNKHDRSTFYVPEPVVGYTDYPSLEIVS